MWGPRRVRRFPLCKCWINGRYIDACMHMVTGEFLRFLVGVDDLEFRAGSFWVAHCWMLEIF